MKERGASQVFDYHSTTAVDEIIKALKGKAIAGAPATESGSAEAISDVVHACDGATFASTD